MNFLLFAKKIMLIDKFILREITDMDYLTLEILLDRRRKEESKFREAKEDGQQSSIDPIRFLSSSVHKLLQSYKFNYPEDEVRAVLREMPRKYVFPPHLFDYLFISVLIHFILIV